MSDRQPTGESGATADQVDTSRPFQPDIKGEVKKRLFKYARDKGRSATNALLWLVGEGLRKEGY